MTTDLISPHEVRVLAAVRRAPSKWWTNRGLAEAANVNPRTVRAHTAQLARLGVLTEARAFGGHRYHLAPDPGPAAREYLARWDEARDLFDDERP